MFFVKEGWPFIFIPLVLGILILSVFRGSTPYALGVLLIVFGSFSAFFFRDPVRSIRDDAGLILSPADGTVMEISEEDGAKCVKIFLSVFNVNLQRSPVEGVVKSVEYRPGKFLPAMRQEAHILNEQNIITIETKDGEYKVKQIAGILARRVVSWVRRGDKVSKGQKIGLIKFGSQVDVYFPKGSPAEIVVAKGDKVVSGITVLARSGK